MSGGSEQLQSIPNSVPTDGGETCAFCLQAVLLRGGRILQAAAKNFSIRSVLLIM